MQDGRWLLTILSMSDFTLNINMENKEYFLLHDEYERPLDGKWTDKFTIIPAGTVIHNVRKRDEATEGFGFEYDVKETGVRSVLFNYTNVIENTPTNRLLLGEYIQKTIDRDRANNQLADIIKQFTTLKR